MVLTEVFYALMGTPLQYLPTANKDSTFANLGLSVTRNLLSTVLINGFVNPLGANLILRQLTDPNHPGSPDVALHKSNLVGTGERVALNFIETGADKVGLPQGYTKFTRAFLKANNNRGYRLEDGTIVRTTRPLRVMVTKKVNMGTVGSSQNAYVRNKNF